MSPDSDNPLYSPSAAESSLPSPESKPENGLKEIVTEHPARDDDYANQPNDRFTNERIKQLEQRNAQLEIENAELKNAARGVTVNQQATAYLESAEVARKGYDPYLWELCKTCKDKLHPRGICKHCRDTGVVPKGFNYKLAPLGAETGTPVDETMTRPPAPKKG